MRLFETIWVELLSGHSKVSTLYSVRDGLLGLGGEFKVCGTQVFAFHRSHSWELSVWQEWGRRTEGAWTWKQQEVMDSEREGGTDAVCMVKLTRFHSWFFSKEPGFRSCRNRGGRRRLSCVAIIYTVILNKYEVLYVTWRTQKTP